MSLKLKIVNFYLKHIKGAKDCKDRMHLLDLLNKEEVKTRDPKNIIFKKEETQNGSIYELNNKSESRYIVFYLHGGAYAVDFTKHHWSFINKIIKHTNARVFTYGYRLTPWATYKEAYDLILPHYKKIVSENKDKKIIIMGDSAGGGLALGIVESLVKDSKTPDEIILLSPWVDVSMSNPELKNYEKSDGWLRITPLLNCSKCWAGNLDLKDYRVSPIYGDFSKLKNVTIFLGSEELLYPDIMKFYNGLVDHSKELYIGKNLKHVFPIFPVKEAKPFVDIIMRNITR